MKILIINGSIRGKLGNSGKIAKKAAEFISFQKETQCSVLTLADPMPSIKDVRGLLNDSDCFLIISGSYWNSCGSLLQRFIEVTTVYENTEVFFGKPVACAISMDSVGGVEVASHIHSVFSAFGCWSPPCSTLVISRVGQEAVKATSDLEDDPNEDVWRLDDIEIVLRNLIVSARIKGDWEHWPNDELTIEEGEWPDTGILDLESPKFL